MWTVAQGINEVQLTANHPCVLLKNHHCDLVKRDSSSQNLIADHPEAVNVDFEGISRISQIPCDFSPSLSAMKCL
jgi:hypothetical protein